MKLSVSGLKELKATFAKLQGQIPFATALALTRTAQAARDEVRRELPKRFTLRSKGLVSLIRSTPATKTNLTATVTASPAFWEIQETGGVKLPRGPLLSIPVGVGRTAGGKVRMTRSAKRKPFVATIGGNKGIYQRLTKRPFPVKLLFTLEPRAVIKPRFHFRETVEDVARRRFADEFSAALAKAIATAR